MHIPVNTVAAAPSPLATSLVSLLPLPTGHLFHHCWCGSTSITINAVDTFATEDATVDTFLVLTFNVLIVDLFITIDHTKM